MHELYDNLNELCEMVEKDLTKTNEKLRMSGGEMSGSDLEYVDKLTHTLKSIKTTMAMLDSEGEESYYSRRGGGSSYYREGGQGGSRGGQGGQSSYYREGGQGGQSSYYREGQGGGGSSYARGRGRNARRDSRGRYSREGGMYYRNSDELVEQLEQMMDQAPNEQIKQRMQQLVQELEQM